MITYKILGILLTYPNEEIVKNLHYVQKKLAEDKLLDQNSLGLMKEFVQYSQSNDVITLQENYTTLFDKCSTLSLHLFEHIHGESRDRGQAMVDLKDTYEKDGFHINASELPDYIPMFLEYLSTLEQKKAKELLSEPVKIFALLEKRLQEASSVYKNIFSILINIIGISNSKKNSLIEEEIKKGKSIKRKTMDEEWEEQPAFDNSNKTSCGNCTYKQSN